MTWTPDRLSQLATGYWHSAALLAGVELGIFDALNDGPRTPDALAEAVGAQPALVVSLLDALVSIGLLSRLEVGEYAIAPSATAVLKRSSPTCMLDALRYNVDLYRHWGKLAEVVRTGVPAAPQQKQLGNDDAMTRRFVRGMESKARAFAPAIAPLIHLDTEKTLLDVGSGPGTVSRMLAERRADLHVTLLDLPGVLNVAKEINAASPVASRLNYHPANYRTDPLPADFDAVLYAGALHQESLESAMALCRSFHRALRPRGRLFVVDLMLNDDRTQPTFSALFQLTMILLNPASRVFSTGELTSLLEQTGFEHVAVREAPSSPYRLVEARRRD